MSLIQAARDNRLIVSRHKSAWMSAHPLTEHVDLALALVHGDISQAQARKALGIPAGLTIYSWFLWTLCKAVNQGLVQIQKVKT